MVPKSYLERWADGNVLRVTEVDSRKSYLAAPGRAARETDFYRFAADDVYGVSLPESLIELMLSKVEGAAVQAIDALIAGGQGEPDPEAAASVAWFMAFQITRGRAYRAQLSGSLDKIERLPYERLDRDGVRHLLEERLERNDVPQDEVDEAVQYIEDWKAGKHALAPSSEWMMALGLDMADKIGRFLLSRQWRVFETPAVLVTADEPVVMVGGPGLSRQERPGLASAGAILFPLAPTALLAMFRSDLDPTHFEPPLTLVDLADVNREIIANASRWAFERPTRKATLNLRVPPQPPATDLEVVQRTERDGGVTELVRMFGRSRWSSDPLTPWPVRHWWAWSSGNDAADKRRASLAVEQTAETFEAHGISWPVHDSPSRRGRQQRGATTRGRSGKRKKR